jgi:hypothetical protein
MQGGGEEGDRARGLVEGALLLFLEGERLPYSDGGQVSQHRGRVLLLRPPPTLDQVLREILGPGAVSAPAEETMIGPNLFF